MISGADTAWLLICTALVMLMTPALGFFYAGLVRRKNALSTIVHSFGMLALISVQWVVVGYSLAFGPSLNGMVGQLGLFLGGVGLEPSAYAPAVPHVAFMAYQMMFAVITPALITGAYAERKRFIAFALFSLVWATLVYDPVAHWVWGMGGWLKELGALDFAGGTVVHIASGFSALVAAKVLGPRLERSGEPHNAAFVVLGAGLLWFGWFGFNAGSALAANELAAQAFVVTHMAAATATLTWVVLSWLHKGQPSLLGAAVGAVAGLVGITPAAGFVTVPESLVIGAITATLCYGACQLRARLRVDDALDVWAVHGVGGVAGALLTGILAGNVAVQAIAVLAVAFYSMVMTWLILKGMGLFIGLRVDAAQEETGLDVSQHGESAYADSFR